MPCELFDPSIGKKFSNLINKYIELYKSVTSAAVNHRYLLIERLITESDP